MGQTETRSNDLAMIYTLDLQPISVGRFVYRLPPSLNRRLHWREAWRQRDAWKTQVGWLLKEQHVPRMTRAKVTFTNACLKKMDRDNAHASLCKPTLDALVENGIIPDDSEEYVDVIVKQVQVHHRSEQRFLMTIESL